MFYDNLEKACKAKGLKAYKATELIGMNRNNVYRWRDRGVVPSGDIIQRFADLLDVSVDELLKDTEYVERPESVTELDDHIQDFILLYHKLSKKDKMRLMALVYDFEDEMNAMYASTDE